MSMADPSPPGIQAYEIGVEGLLELLGNDPGNRKKALRLLLRQIMPPGHMPLGKDQAVAPGEGVDVQDAQGKFIFINPVGLRLPRNDPAENTGRGFASLLGLAFSFPFIVPPSYRLRN